MELGKKILSKFKEYEIISLIIAICYFAGYFSFTYHYRLLGVETSASPLEYLTLGGDFFISSIIKTVKVPLDYSADFLSNLFVGEFCMAFWPLGVIGIIKLGYRGIKKNWIKTTAFYISVTLFFCFNFVLLNWQSSNLKMDNLLTVNPQRLYPKYPAKTFIEACELMQEIYDDHLLSLQTNSPRTFKRIDRWFNMHSTEDLSRNRLVSYSGLTFLLIIGFLIWASIIRHLYYGRNTWINWACIALLGMNFIFLPISYGILGKSYQVPYGMVQVQPGQDTLRNRVYLLKEDSDNYVVYDKMNFFQIKYIPKSEVRRLNQLFTLTPFQSPLKDQVSICDSLLAIPGEIDY